eukprot:scaffold127944_cov72-Phaeocystis_antarctica.AAC.9
MMIVTMPMYGSSGSLRGHAGRGGGPRRAQVRQARAAHLHTGLGRPPGCCRPWSICPPRRSLSRAPDAARRVRVRAGPGAGAAPRGSDGLPGAAAGAHAPVHEPHLDDAVHDRNLPIGHLEDHDDVASVEGRLHAPTASEPRRGSAWAPCVSAPWIWRSGWQWAVGAPEHHDHGTIALGDDHQALPDHEGRAHDHRQVEHLVRQLPLAHVAQRVVHVHGGVHAAGWRARGPKGRNTSH